MNMGDGWPWIFNSILWLGINGANSCHTLKCINTRWLGYDMFSGIVAGVGIIEQVENRDGGLDLRISTQGLCMEDVKAGDSIAVNGVCLTAVCVEDRHFCAHVSRETLNCTAGLDAEGTRVNLEKALCVNDRLGGHLVSGHVDGVGDVVEFTNLEESWKLKIAVPQSLAKYMVVKGSIAINGVSLTVNNVEGNVCSMNLIPHTLEATTLKELHVGAQVNIETDLIARYVERLLQARG